MYNVNRAKFTDPMISMAYGQLSVKLAVLGVLSRPKFTRTKGEYFTVKLGIVQ